MTRRFEESFDLPEEVVRFEAPELLARRARLRRVVAGALSASVGLLLVGVLLRYSARQAEAALNRTALARSVSFNALLPRSASAPPSAQPAAALANSSGPTALSSSLDANALTHAARVLLEAGHTREGIVAARSAVEASPNDAEPYLLLATGLQDLGNWPAAHQVFKDCELKTQRGPRQSCRYFAGN